MKVLNTICAIILCFLTLTSKGQDTFGTISSNYTPTNSLALNPSSMLDAKTWLDINIVGFGNYANNDLVYLENSSALSAYKEYKRGDVFDENRIKFNQNRNRYHAYDRAFANSLIGVWSQGDHAVGILFGGKAITDARRIDGVTAQFIENGISQYTEQHLQDYSLKRFRVNSLAYGEALFSYAYTFKKQRRDMFMGGISFKKIFPLVGGFASIRDFSYNVQDDIQLSVFNLTGDVMAFTQPEFSFKGGWGFDLGFTWQKMYRECSSYYPNSKKGGCNRVPYQWKLGISIIDIGYAKFNKDNINYVGYDFQSYEWFNYADISADETNAPNLFEAQESNPSEGIIRKPHKVSLPTYLSVQFDYNLRVNWLYFNATWIHGIPPTKGAFGPRRAHSLSFTPRIETKWIDFSLPISLYEYRYPQLGANLRIYFLTIGTDKLINWIIRSDVYGADFYFYLKVPLFRNPKCKNRGGGFSGKNRGRRGKRDIPRCDAYR